MRCETHLRHIDGNHPIQWGCEIRISSFVSRVAERWCYIADSAAAAVAKWTRPSNRAEYVAVAVHHALTIHWTAAGVLEYRIYFPMSWNHRAGVKVRSTSLFLRHTLW